MRCLRRRALLDYCVLAEETTRCGRGLATAFLASPGQPITRGLDVATERPPESLLWGPLLLAWPVRPCYDQARRGDMGAQKLTLIKRQLFWVLLLVSLLTACRPLEDLGKTVEDLLKRFTG